MVLYLPTGQRGEEQPPASQPVLSQGIWERHHLGLRHLWHIMGHCGYSQTYLCLGHSSPPPW